MAGFTRKTLDTALEKQILTKMITNTDFLQGVYDFIQVEYFTTSYISTIADWVLDYYEQYSIAPNKDIQNIFNQKEVTLDEAEAALFRTLLQSLSDVFEAGTDDENCEYLQTRALSFCRKRELEITAGNIKHYLEQNEVDAAEDEILHFRKVCATVSKCVDIFADDIVGGVFEEKEAGILQLSNYLGKFLGSWHRSWLVVFSGAYKRGKSWWLLDAYITALMSGKRVVFFSLEMTQDNILERIYHRVTGCTEEAQETLIPVVDCKLNQSGDCARLARPDQIPLMVDNELPPFDEVGDTYQICTACREDDNSPFQPTVWYERKQTLAMTKGLVANKARSLTNFYGDNAKLKTYPRFSANISDIRRDLDVLEAIDGYIPDIILVDYADILKPESNNTQGTQKEDETWIALSQLAGERKALVVTATQITKEGQSANIVGLEHTARWSGKLGHVDAIYGINQTAKEKEQGVMRMSTLLHRHQSFSTTQQCAVLQNLDIGAIHLDSYPYTREAENNEN